MLALLALTLSALALAASVALTRRVRGLEARLREFEARPPSLEGPRPAESPLAGLRVEIAIRQDHPLSPFEGVLAEALGKEGALTVGAGASVRISGTLKGNGYADVYFDADLTVEYGGQPLLRFREWPPHGDRPENLARELVVRLKAEWQKRERQGALRELGSP